MNPSTTNPTITIPKVVIPNQYPKGFKSRSTSHSTKSIHIKNQSAFTLRDFKLHPNQAANTPAPIKKITSKFAIKPPKFTVKN